MLTKYAAIDASTAVLVPHGTLAKWAHRHDFIYEPRPGYLYVRSRAISSRTNDNFDTFPAEELRKSWQTFIGKPVFVNHHNDDHTRMRGVCIDAVLHDDTAPDGTEDVWVEVLMEVDALRFPLLAAALIRKEIERTSMGTDVVESECSFCGNVARVPDDYCAHVRRMKGQRLRRKNSDTGEVEDVLVHEICRGLSFFENSLLVEDPADPTAYTFGLDTRGLDLVNEGLEHTASLSGDRVASLKLQGYVQRYARTTRATRGVPCAIPEIGREAVAMVRRMERGTATAADILRCVTGDGRRGAGVQWGLGDSEFGDDWADQGAEEYAFVNDDTIVKEWIEDNVDGGWSATDDEIWEELHDNLGELQVILIGDSEAEYVNGDWDASIGRGAKVRLTEVRYNAGWGWKHLPANGLTVTSRIEPRTSPLPIRHWAKLGYRVVTADGLGAMWFAPGKKRPIGTTTQATSYAIGLLAEEGLTFSEGKARLLWDTEGQAILQKYIDLGYGDTRMTDLGVRTAKVASWSGWTIDGQPYSTGVWLEVRGLYILDDDGPFPCRRVIKPVGGEFAWSVAVPVTGFGPNAGKVLSGTAATLDAAKEKALSCTRRDAEANGKYVERMNEMMGRTAMAAGPITHMGTPKLKYDYYGTPERIAILDPEAEPARPGDTYFTTEPVEDWRSRKKREDWEAGNGTTKRKPAPKWQEGSGTADEGTVAFLDFFDRTDCLFIAYMGVRPDQRRQGFAKQLVEWVYREAHKRGKAYVDWGTVFYPANRMYWDFYDRDMPVATKGHPLDPRGASRTAAYWPESYIGHDDRADPTVGYWYHGSRSKLPPGTILSGTGPRRGVPMWSETYENEPERGEYVWVTNSVEEAVTWAEKDGWEDEEGVHVYRVEPMDGPVRPWNPKELHDGFVVPRARVLTEVHQFPRGLPVGELDPFTASLSLENIISVAEQAMERTGNAGRTIHSVCDALDLDSVTVAECKAASATIYDRSQAALVADGFDDEFVVHRTEGARVGSDRGGVVPVTFTSAHHLRGDTTAYRVRRSDVLTYARGLNEYDSYAGEGELQVERSKLQVVKTATFVDHPTLSTFGEEIEDSILPEMSDQAQSSRERWVYNSKWPTTYLSEASSGSAYEMLQANLKRLGFPAEVSMVRNSFDWGLQGSSEHLPPIINASLWEGWLDRSTPERVIFTVPREDIVGFGALSEDEVFVRTDRVRIIKSGLRTTAEALGDCYEAAGRFILDDMPKADESDYFLCHGLVTGNGGLAAGRRFSHAWVEHRTAGGWEVIDRSNGRNITMDRDTYYGIGEIRESEVYRYTPVEAMKQMLRLKHWGPWDESKWDGIERVGTVVLDDNSWRAMSADVDGLHVEFSSYGDAVPGGYNGGWLAKVNGQVAGYIDYQTENGGGDVLIAMIEVEPEWRSKGISDALLARLRAEFPGRTIDPGMMTPDGAKWWKRVGARDDAHSVKNFDPAQYSYIGYLDMKEVEASEVAERIIDHPQGQTMETLDWAYSVYNPAASELNGKLVEHVQRNHHRGNWSDRGGCDMCGAHGLRHVNIYEYKPDGDWIVLGADCTEKAGLENRNAYEIARAQDREQARKKAEELRQTKERWRAALNDVEGLALLDRLIAADKANEPMHGILRDLVRKYKQYGSLSEKQMDLMRKIFDEEEVRRLEQESPALIVKMPVPEGTQTITGTIISTKWQESQYGSTLKCLVEDTRGFRVWGTVPGAAQWGKGDKVTFVANIERSDDDPYFGFYKRPRQFDKVSKVLEGQEVYGPFAPTDRPGPSRYSRSWIVRYRSGPLIQSYLFGTESDAAAFADALRSGTSIRDVDMSKAKLAKNRSAA